MPLEENSIDLSSETPTLQNQQRENEAECKEMQNVDEESKEAFHLDCSSDLEEGLELAKEKKEAFKVFLTVLDAEQPQEVKLQKLLKFMEQTLSCEGAPDFRSFWQARIYCLELFKGNVSPAIRSELWTNYQDLSKEARRLKEILDEQSAFAVEQIDIAIKALEDDLERLKKQEVEFSLTSFPVMSEALKANAGSYQSLQGSLDLLNTLAMRVNALRKELIRTAMRIRIKNKFFERLSFAGDQIFPRRKSLIKEISELFAKDVQDFIKIHFQDDRIEGALFALREEIKALQGIAKILTLNSHTFTHTRMSLSQCWDKIKVFEKEKKKQRLEQKALFKESESQVREKIAGFKDAFQSEDISEAQGEVFFTEIASLMRSLRLGKDEVKALREEIMALKQEFFGRLREKELAKEQVEMQKQAERKIKCLEIKQEIERLLADPQNLSEEELMAAKAGFEERIVKLKLAKHERLEIEKCLKQLGDAAMEKKEAFWAALSEDEKSSKQQLQEVLAQYRKRRDEIKSRLDRLRKATGGSGLDFEKAMSYNAQLTAEKENLEKINSSIQDVEQKIVNLSR